MAANYDKEFPYIEQGDPMEVINILWDETERARRQVERLKKENTALKVRVRKNIRRINDALIIVKCTMVVLAILMAFIGYLYYSKELPQIDLIGVDIIIAVEFALIAIWNYLRK